MTSEVDPTIAPGPPLPTGRACSHRLAGLSYQGVFADDAHPPRRCPARPTVLPWQAQIRGDAVSIA